MMNLVSTQNRNLIWNNYLSPLPFYRYFNDDFSQEIDILLPPLVIIGRLIAHPQEFNLSRLISELEERPTSSGDPLQERQSIGISYQ